MDTCFKDITRAHAARQPNLGQSLSKLSITSRHVPVRLGPEPKKVSGTGSIPATAGDGARRRQYIRIMGSAKLGKRVRTQYGCSSLFDLVGYPP